MDQLYLIQKVLGPLTKEQMESFNKNPRFVGLKFPEITKPETLEKRYMTSLSKKALQLMIGLLQLDPANRLTGEQALRHAYFDDIREPEVEEELSSLIAPVQRPIYSSQSRITSYGQKFGNTYLQSQLIQPGIGLTNQRQNGSVSVPYLCLILTCYGFCRRAKREPQRNLSTMAALSPLPQVPILTAPKILI